MNLSQDSPCSWERFRSSSSTTCWFVLVQVQPWAGVRSVRKEPFKGWAADIRWLSHDARHDPHCCYRQGTLTQTHTHNGNLCQKHTHTFPVCVCLHCSSNPLQFFIILSISSAVSNPSCLVTFSAFSLHFSLWSLIVCLWLSGWEGRLWKVEGGKLLGRRPWEQR